MCRWARRKANLLIRSQSGRRGGQRRTTREWLESLDPAEFQEIFQATSEIECDRQDARHRKLEEKRRGPRQGSRRTLPAPGARQVRRGGVREERRGAPRVARPLLVPLPLQE